MDSSYHSDNGLPPGGEHGKPFDQVKSLEARAALLAQAERYEEAALLLQEAVNKRSAMAGVDDPGVACLWENIGELYMKQHMPVQAEVSLAKARRILERAYYPEHSTLAPVLEELAECFIMEGKLGEAEPLLKKSADIYSNTMTMENRNSLRSFYKLAKLYIQMDRPDDAKKVIEKAMKFVDTPLGPVSEFRYQMALAQVMSKNTSEAKDLLKAASDGFKQRHNYLRVVECLNTYAQICRSIGEDTQAEVAMKEAYRYKSLENFYPEDIFVATLLRA